MLTCAWNRRFCPFNLTAQDPVPVEFSWLESSWPFARNSWGVQDSYLYTWRYWRFPPHVVPIRVYLGHYNIQLRIVEDVLVTAFDLVLHCWVVAHPHPAQLRCCWVPQLFEQLWALFVFALVVAGPIVWLFQTSTAQVQFSPAYRFTFLGFFCKQLELDFTFESFQLLLELSIFLLEVLSILPGERFTTALYKARHALKSVV